MLISWENYDIIILVHILQIVSRFLASCEYLDRTRIFVTRHQLFVIGASTWYFLL